MDLPSDIEKVVLIGVMRTLHLSLDNVASTLRVSKSTIMDVESWIAQASLSEVEAVFADSAIKSLTARELPGLEEVDNKVMVRAGQVSKNDVLRHYRQDWVLRGGKAASHIDSPRIERHRKQLLEVVIPELKGIDVLPARDFSLATWYLRTGETTWPIARGRIEREPGGRLTVRLYVEGKLEWEYLRQHLKDDPVWRALDAWKRAVTRDVSMRLSLLGQIVDRIKDEIGLPVLENLGAAREESSAVDLYYAFTIYDQVFCRVLGVALTPKRKDEFMLEMPNTIYLGGRPVVRSPDPALRIKAINFLLQAQTAFVELPRALEVKRAYKRVQDRTGEIKKHADRIRLSVAFPDGSKCEGCKFAISAQK